MSSIQSFCSQWAYIQLPENAKLILPNDPFSHLPLLGEVLMYKSWNEVLAETNLWLLQNGKANQSNPMGLNWTFQVSQSLYRDLGINLSLQQVAQTFLQMSLDQAKLIRPEKTEEKKETFSGTKFQKLSHGSCIQADKSARAAKGAVSALKI